MKTLRDKCTRKKTSALSSHLEHDFVIENNLQPELSYNKFSTIFSSQLAPETYQQTARQKLRQYINLKKANTIENVQFQSREFQPTKTQVLYPKIKSVNLKYNPRSQSLLLDQENNFNSLNLASTQRTVNKLHDAKQIQKYLEKQRLMNLQLKQETENLRTQIYQLRNVEIQLEKIKIYVRKLQTQLNDQNSITFDLKQQNQQLLKKLNYFQDQLQVKLKDSQLLETELMEAKRTIEQLGKEMNQKEMSYEQEKLQNDTYLKQFQRQSYEKSNELTQLYLQLKKLNLQVDEKEKENAQLYSHYEQSLKVVQQMEQKMSQMKNQQAQIHKNWQKQVQRNEILFRQLQKVIEEKCRQTSQLQTDLKEMKQKLEKLQIKATSQADSTSKEINQLKEQNEKLKKQIEGLNQTKQAKIEHEESMKRQYVPKKWFQEKIYYEYTLNSLQNELQSLKQQNEDLLKSRQNLLVKQTQKQQSSVVSFKDKSQNLNNSQTQTEQINLGEIQLQQSEKSRIIQEQQEKIFCLQKQLNQVYTQIDHQKYSLEQNYSQRLNDLQGKYRELHLKYNQEKENLLKQKQRTEDLTMELLLLNQEVQQSRVKIRSKEHL